MSLLRGDPQTGHPDLRSTGNLKPQLGQLAAPISTDAPHEGQTLESLLVLILKERALLGLGTVSRCGGWVAGTGTLCSVCGLCGLNDWSSAVRGDC